ncbi:ABC transporter ATP-binding protein [Miniphocaeibacter halophilus]|uniref:ABC transporter ATP-binding protein n=1 Tax=Miniphocaeibacter halophilus TaxID=2931922 RepID=UPI001FB25D62|nr:ABC transporter ATP-binding protein [Miniphocaeibacter halophilus]
MAILEISNLKKSYKSGNSNLQVLRNLSLKVEEGEFVSIMGSSGSGKSTLLNCICRYIDYESGLINLKGNDIGKFTEEDLATMRNTNIGFIFQDYMLLDGLNLIENTCVPSIISKMKKTNTMYESMEEKAKNLLNLFGLAEKMDSFPAELSGGQRQRVSIARSLINSPDIILADEPTGNLDSKSANEVIDSFTRIKKDLNTSILMVTHDMYYASYSDKVFILNKGEISKVLVNKGNRKELQDEIVEAFANMDRS